MKKTGLLLLSLLLLSACGKKPSPEEQALAEAKASAQTLYDHLLAGRYDQFLSGRDGMDSIPESYREQLLTSYKQFMAQQRQAHGGINYVSVSNARIDSTEHAVLTFLILHYQDNTQEEIVVPMVERNQQWKIR